MNLKGGIVIIGSLLWDDEKERKKWRDNDLCYKNRFKVYVPIRYGRCSCTRNNTFTMVFSNICYLKIYGLGIGWVLPIKAEINSFDKLKEEAQKMGKAEGFKDDGLSKDWGSVALLINPNKKVDNSIRTEWGKLMSSKISDHLLLSKKLKSEKSPIDSNGFLAIRWPEKVTLKNKIGKLDFLIATVTTPTLNKGRYPTVHQIANAMKKAKYCDYFCKNRENEITTFQDERILKELQK